MNPSESGRNPVEELAEEFMARYRRGERPAIAEYTDQYPELADQIRDLFPALVMMEEVRPETGDATGNFEPGPALPGTPKLERLGDFRILREVGHGGMGIVYEAEQESLGRHVALKVLLTHSLLDPSQLKRFQREARAAAHLHHTNIVPVHGVGEHEGLHYYIMQFIQGQGLDQVLAELKHLKHLRNATRNPSQAGEDDADRRRNPGSVTAMAQGLLSGRYTATGLGGASRRAQPAPGPSAAAGEVLEGSEVQRPAPLSPAVSPRTEEKRAATATDIANSSAIHLPGQAEHSTLTHSSRQYFQSVARIGVQVAEALAYAHAQGIQHRDIKPSNLLLDTQGTVWVTDFGLAKATADHDELTHTGDIVGTLRYMAPERFNGQSDVRSDLYSLGLTLYELLTLHAAFDESDRNKLVQQVMHGEPPPPRKLNSAVPRDLETIVLKATARDPAHRYQTPTDLADDLKRFVEDRPIRARRASVRERLWRWCRRNPVVAALIAAVQVTLLGLLALASWSHLSISQALHDKDKALAEEARQRSQADSARAEAMKLRDAAVAQAYRALLSETRALRLAHTSGWRYQALHNLQSLARLDTPKRNLADLRSEAIACIGAFDASLATRFVGHTESIWSLDFSPDGSLLASAGYDGRVQLWDVNEGRQVRAVLDPAVNLARRHFDTAPLPAVRFRPDGSSLAHATWNKGVALLGLRADQAPTASLGAPSAARYLAFDTRGRLLAVSWGDGRVCLYNAASGQLQREIQTKVGVNYYFPVALSPDGSLLAAIGPQNTVQLYTVADDKGPISLGRHRGTVRSLCFSPAGDVLASASEDHSVKLWRITRPGEDPITLLGHNARVNCVAFSPDGNLAASASDDQTVRLWATRTGLPLMVLHPGNAPWLSVAISPDGSRLAVGGARSNGSFPVCLYQLTSRQEKRRLAGHTYFVQGLAFHPFQPTLVSGGGDRNLILWDLRTGRQRHLWPGTRGNPIYTVAFAPAGDLLAVGVGSFGTPSGKDFAIDLRDVETGAIRRRLVGPQGDVHGLAFDPRGKLLAAGTSGGSTFLWNPQTGETVSHWQSPGGTVQEVAFLNAGAQLVTGQTGGRVAIRDLAQGKTVQETTIPGGLNCLGIAPGDRVLAVGGRDGTLRILAVPGLETTATLEKAHEGTVQAVCFSPDGRLLASGDTSGAVVFWDAHTYQRLCTLPNNGNVQTLAFDPDSLRLAIGSSDELIALWNLALVRPELAMIGLDWNAPRPLALLPAGVLAAAEPPPPVKIVRVPLKPVQIASQPGGTANPQSELDSLYRQGRYQELIAAAAKAIQAAPRAKALYVTLANAHYQLGQYAQAAEAAQRHLDLCPHCSWALGRLASCRVALGAPEEAIKLLDQALQAHPTLPGPCNSLAWIYVSGPDQVRNPEKALPLAQKAVALAPTNRNYQNTLGVVYYRLGKFDKAVNTLLGASQPGTARSTEALNQLFLAMSYHQLGEFARAKQCFAQAPRLSPVDRLDRHTIEQLQAIRAEAAALLGIE